MKKYILKRKFSDTCKIIENFLTLSYVWITFLLLCLSIICLFISMYNHSINNEFVASIFGNVFVGLLTGIVILLINNIKNIQKYKIEIKKKKLYETHGLILAYDKSFRKIILSKYENDDKFFEDAYDEICLAQEVNSSIINTSKIIINFEKYFNKKFDFKVLDQEKKCSDIRDYISYNSNNAKYAEEVIKRLRNYDNELMKLNKKILKQIGEYDFKINIIDKSII